MDGTFQRPGPLRLDATNMEDEWKFFIQKFNLFLLASGASKKEEQVRLAMFLNFIGDEALKVYNTFTYDQEGDAKKLDVVTNKFQEYCTPRKNVVHERYMFWKLTQQPGESVDSFVTTLRLRAASCQFGDQTESMIRDRVVLGCPDRQVQERMLREADLTLQKALDVCRAAEATRAQIKTITSDSEAVHLVSERIVSQPDKAAQQSQSVRGRSCGNCGRSHPPKSCPAFGKSCNACHKPNHFAKQCRSQGKFQTAPYKSRPGYRSKSRPRHNSSTSVSEVQSDVEMLHISTCNRTEGQTSWFKDFEIFGKQITCKLDSGAEANVMSIDTLKEFIQNPQLESTNTVLTSYTSESSRPLGKIVLPIQHHNKQYQISFFIVNQCTSTLIGLPACKQLDVLRRVDTLSKAPNTILDQYSDVFCGLGCYPGEYHIAVDPSVMPVVNPPRRVPLSVQPKLKQKLDSLVKTGVLMKRDEPTDWVNSLLIVEKKDKSLRLCLDPRQLNLAIKREHYVIPTADDIISRLHGKSVFTIIDMKDAFWQVKLDEASSKVCTFNSPFGRYSFLRMPFGISSAPEVLQKRNEEAFGDINNAHVVFDDLIVAAADDDEHDSALHAVLQRARQLNIKFSKDKVQYRVKQVRYLGHIITADGVSPDPDKVNAIIAMEQPADKKALLRFIGMLTYLSKFIPNFSDLTAPLRNLLKKDVSWSWSDCHETAFQNLKKVVASAPLLRYFDPAKPVVIQTDSSSTGLGSCLLQDGRPIAFASRALTDAETRYAQIEKELLSVVYSCEKFYQYIYGHKTVVHSDHKPLESIYRKSISATTPRLQRMLLRLLKFELDIQYVPGKEMYLADTLSRAYISEVPSRAECEISDDIEVTVHSVLHNTTISCHMLDVFRAATERDPVLSELRSKLRSGELSSERSLSGELRVYAKIASDIYEADGILFHNSKVIVPAELRGDMLKRIHEGHLGMDKSKSLARTTLYWPGMSRDIENLIARCSTCNSCRRQQPSEPLLPYSVPDYPWQRVGADIFTLYGRDYLLVVDYYSKFPEICHLHGKTASEVIVNLKSIFSRNGIPEEVVADNMPFGSREFHQFAVDWNFSITTTSPNYPKSNGQAERAIQTVKGLLRKAEQSGTDPNIALLQYRNAAIAGSTLSPAQLLMSRNLRSKIPATTKLLQPRVTDGRSQLQSRQDKQKAYHDRHVKELKPLKPGDVVRIRHNGEWMRGVVRNRHHAPRSYVVKTHTGVLLRRNRRHLINTAEDSPVTSTPLLDDIGDDMAASVPRTVPPIVPQTDPERRTSSGRVTRHPVRFQDYVVTL